MAREVLIVPESMLKSMIKIIENGIKASEEEIFNHHEMRSASELLMEWCDSEKDYLRNLERDENERVHG